MKSWSPMRAKTLRQKTVKIMTFKSFFTDWMSAATMVFRPGKERNRRRDQKQPKTVCLNPIDGGSWPIEGALNKLSDLTEIACSPTSDNRPTSNNMQTYQRCIPTRDETYQ